MGRCPPGRRLSPRSLGTRPRISLGTRPRSLSLSKGALALLLAGLAACSPATPSPAAASVAARLEAALAARSVDDFVGTFATVLDAEARSWYAVLAAGDATVTAPGPGRLRVTYRLPGDRATAAEEVAYSVAAGTLSQVRTDGARPLWTLAGVELTPTAGGTLLSIGLDEPARSRWAGRLTASAALVQAERLPVDWPGGLVVEIPPEGRFARVAGASVAASAITTCTAGTPRIVVNPAVLSQPDEWLDSTVVHEAVHVATNTACGPAAPAWVVEGLAESVAARSDAATASRNRDLVRGHVREHGLPDALPERMESLGDYALAQVAVDALRAHLGRRADGFLRRALAGAPGPGAAELADATRWYVAEVRRLAG